ncbi:MAG: enolase, partial [Caldilineaceae bacterium]|nr:enolase [Caldilineaceae bacterium]
GRRPRPGARRGGWGRALRGALLVGGGGPRRGGAGGAAPAPPRPTIYGETVASIVSVIAQELAPRVTGLPLAHVSARLGEVAFNHTAKGAIDIALHDALAQSRGVTLAEHLGCTAERVAVSYILGIGDRESVLAEAQRVYEQGVRVLKVKVGREWDEDLARIRDLQAMFGDAMAFYADANECLTPDNAAWKLAHLRELGLRYCEEPLPVELIGERAALRAARVMPLIADDSCFSVRDLRRELACGTFDILNIKTARTGYTESRQMLASARAAGKGVMVGSQASAGLGTVRAALFAALPGIDHPSELSFFLKLKEDILDRPLAIRDGFLTLAEVLDVRIEPNLLRTATVR